MTEPAGLRMTAPRLAALIAAGDGAAVRSAVDEAPRLLRAPVERDGVSGWTPLHLAVAGGREELVTALVEAGADLAATTEDGRTPLHVALQHAPALVGVLRGLGAPVDAASAAFLGDVPALAGHLDAGAPLRDPATGVGLLRWAAHGGSVPAARLLLGRGADADADALHAAAGAGAAQVVGLLLTAGADVAAREPDTGRTPLHTAVATAPEDAAAEVVRRLLAAGADVDATTSDGASALDISRVAAARDRAAGRPAAARDEVTALLVAAGARH
ncbi:ankyrin repeat domain-containing protein [Modestobacter sp. NPDC049651]|uniref:ankyrin repeat domain-containing protein n=1 Tax=unclassified Modestobacter TaxID=2643866 RepID=UPI0033C38DB1